MTSRCKDDFEIQKFQIAGLKRTKSETFCCSEPFSIDLRPFADKCAICSKMCQFRCRRCQSSFYCGRAHQLDHWSMHRRHCKQSENSYRYKAPGSQTSMVICSTQQHPEEDYEFRKGMMVKVNEDHEKLGGTQGCVLRALQPDKRHNGYIKVKIGSKVFAILASSLTVLGTGPPEEDLNAKSRPDSGSDHLNPKSRTDSGSDQSGNHTSATDEVEVTRHGIGYQTPVVSKEEVSCEVMSLVEMGFEFSQASQALKKCNGDVSSAANFLFSGEVVEEGQVESSEFLAGIFDSVEEDEDSSVLCSGDYQLTGGCGEYFHVKGVRYYSMAENGVRFFISEHSPSGNELIRQEVQLDVSDLFINSHFSPSAATAISTPPSPSSVTSPLLPRLSQKCGLPVDPSGALLKDKDRVAVLISYFELHPTVDDSTEYHVVLSSSVQNIQPLFSNSTLTILSTTTSKSSSGTLDDVPQATQEFPLSLGEMEKVDQMTAMGVERDMALQALQRNYFNLALAFESLFDGSGETETSCNTAVAPSTHDRFWTCKMCDYSSSYVDIVCSSCGCPRI